MRVGRVKRKAAARLLLCEVSLAERRPVVAVESAIGRNSASTRQVLRAIRHMPAVGVLAGAGAARAGASGGRFCRSVAAPSATADQTAWASALRSAKSAGSSGACSSTVARSPRYCARRQKCDAMSMSPYQANSGRAAAARRQPGEPVVDHRHRLDQRRGSAPSASAKKDERNGSTREPSEVVPSGNRTRLSPAGQPALHRVALAPGARARCRLTNTVRPSRATVLIKRPAGTSPLETKHASNRPPSTGMSSHEEWLETNTTGRPAQVREPASPHPKSDDAAEPIPVQPRKPDLRPTGQRQTDALNGHREQSPQHYEGQAARRPDPAHRAAPLPAEQSALRPGAGGCRAGDQGASGQSPQAARRSLHQRGIARPSRPDNELSVTVSRLALRPRRSFIGGIAEVRRCPDRSGLSTRFGVVDACSKLAGEPVSRCEENVRARGFRHFPFANVPSRIAGKSPRLMPISANILGLSWAELYPSGFPQQPFPNPSRQHGPGATSGTESRWWLVCRCG